MQYGREREGFSSGQIDGIMASLAFHSIVVRPGPWLAFDPAATHIFSGHGRLALENVSRQPSIGSAQAIDGLFGTFLAGSMTSEGFHMMRNRSATLPDGRFTLGQIINDDTGLVITELIAPTALGLNRKSVEGALSYTPVAASFSPDGMRVITRSFNGLVVVWDGHSGWAPALMNKGPRRAVIGGVGWTKAGVPIAVTCDGAPPPASPISPPAP